MFLHAGIGTQRGQFSLAGMEDVFLRNHADGIVAMDLFVVPTISFRLLYGLLIMGHGRRQILWFGLTAQPTAEWIPISSLKPVAGSKSLVT